MNPRFPILRDFAEVRIEFRNFLQSLLLRESIIKARLNFRVSLLKKSIKILGAVFLIIFFTSKLERKRTNSMAALVTDQQGPVRFKFESITF